MSTLSIVVFLFLVALDRLSQMNKGTTILKHQHALYRLRDNLRADVMAGKIHADNWLFQYLDSSITKSIDALPGLTLWRILVSLAFDSKETQGAAHTKLWRDLEKPGNSLLARHHQEFGKALVVFLTERHTTVRVLTSRIIGAVSFGDRAGNWCIKKISKLTELPKTSTLGDFAPSS